MNMYSFTFEDSADTMQQFDYSIASATEMVKARRAAFGLSTIITHVSVQAGR